jgi:hypothetical protein
MAGKVHGKNGGYGAIAVHGRMLKAHRVSWELAYGPIPAGLYVLHRCDVRDCVNPEHLFLGTHEDNQKDMRAKGRAKYGLGGRRPAFGEGDIIDIRTVSALGATQRAIAAAYGVSQTTIGEILLERGAYA